MPTLPGSFPFPSVDPRAPAFPQPPASPVCASSAFMFLVEVPHFVIILFGYWVLGVSQQALGPRILPKAAELSTCTFWEPLPTALGSWSCIFPELLGVGVAISYP